MQIHTNIQFPERKPDKAQPPPKSEEQLQNLTQQSIKNFANRLSKLDSPDRKWELDRFLDSVLNQPQEELENLHQSLLESISVLEENGISRKTKGQAGVEYGVIMDMYHAVNFSLNQQMWKSIQEIKPPAEGAAQKSVSLF